MQDRSSKTNQLDEVPAFVVDVDDYIATKLMTHTNIYGRDEILLSEKAKAYRMCLDEEKRLEITGLMLQKMLVQERIQNDRCKDMFVYLICQMLF